MNDASGNILPPESTQVTFEVNRLPTYGDYNGDGMVDAADYLIWRNHLGTTALIPNDITPGDVTQEDFDVWKENFGASGQPAASEAVAPEPGADWLLAVASLFSMLHRLRQSSPKSGLIVESLEDRTMLSGESMTADSPFQPDDWIPVTDVSFAMSQTTASEDTSATESITEQALRVPRSASAEGLVVDALTFGFDPADATSALQAAIDTGAQTVIVPNMGTDWIIRPVFLNNSNQEIIFEEGVVVTAKVGEFHGQADSLFSGWSRENITITGYGATLRMQKQDYLGPDYTWSESRMGLRFYSFSNLVIQGLTIRDTGGDGIFLGVDIAPTLNSNVVIRDVVLENNYRQGISVVSAENLLIENSIFRTTGGTSPQSGIDFEPNYDYDRLINVVIRNSVFEGNQTAGFLLNLFSYVDTSLVSGSVENSTFIGNYLYGIKLRVPVPDFTIKDNIFVDNGLRTTSPFPGVGVFVENANPDFPGLNQTIIYSAFYENKDGAISGHVNFGPGSITNVEPLFASTNVNTDTYMYLAVNNATTFTQGDSDGSFMGARPVLVPLLGDATNDGQVTAADLIAVRQNLGNVGPPLNGFGTLLGDANDDGQVTAEDLITVRQNMGNVAPLTASTVAQSGSADGTIIMAGDFDGDGSLEAGDIDLMMAEIASGTGYNA